MTDPNPDGRPVAHFFGFILMAAGVLWIAFCGLCAFQFIGNFFPGSKTAGDMLFAIFVTFAPAALGAAVGYALFAAGRNLWRAK